jgi:hypothetical protein
MRIAETHEARALGVAGIARLERNGSKLVDGSA